VVVQYLHWLAIENNRVTNEKIQKAKSSPPALMLSFDAAWKEKHHADIFE